MKIPFIGQSYVQRTKSFDSQRTVNLYPVKSEVGDSKSVIALMGTPGLSEFIDFGLTSGVRGEHQINERAFVVVGDNFYEIYSNKTYILRGTLETITGVVELADNGNQVGIVDGDNLYIFNLTTSIFDRIQVDGWRGSFTIAFIDGYFLFTDPDTQIFYITALNDGTSIDALDFASAESSPDNLLAVRAVNKEAWLFGTNSVEVWFNSGASLFPFERIQGAFIKYGCAAKYSAVTTAKTVFWLGNDDDGSGTIWMAQGYQPQRISTFAVENAIQGYGNISDAVGHSYQEGGHYFYVLNFPTAGTTWAYDINLDLWHERQYFNPVTSLYERARPQNHIFVFGKHLVGDYARGIVYEQNLSFLDDDGDIIRRLRTSQHEFDSKSLDYIFYSKFQLDMQAGVGITTGNIEDTSPSAILDWSDDGGYTWSNEHFRSMGKIGEYRKRVIWRRLGRGRDRVFRLTIAARVPVFIIDAYAEAELGKN